MFRTLSGLKVWVHRFKACRPIPGRRWGIPKNSWRNFSRASALWFKIHTENENAYAHSLIENYSSVKQQIQERLFAIDNSVTTRPADELDWTRKDAQEVYKTFVNDTLRNKDQPLDMESPKLIPFCYSLARIVPDVSDEQLQAIVYLLRLCKETESPATRNYRTVWNAVDAECVRRLKNWDIATSFLVADLWYVLKLGRLARFNRAMIEKLLANLNNLSNSDVMRLLFYINLQRTWNTESMRRIEKKLEKSLLDVKTEELSILALAFFKTQTQVQSERLLENIIERLLTDIGSLPSIAVTAFAKMLRHSCKPKLMPLYNSLLNSCVPHLSKWHPTSALHLTLITSTTLLDHETFFKQVVLEVKPKLSELRLKDLVKLLHCLAKFDRAPRPDSDFYVTFLEEIRSKRRQEEIHLYPDCLVAVLTNLSYCQVFPEDLLNRALSPEFAERVVATSGLDQRELLELDCTVAIELPQYKGPHLSPMLRNQLWKKHRSKIPQVTNASLTFHETLLLDLQQSLSNILGGPDHVHMCQTLPHYNLADILLQFDSSGRTSLPITNKSSDLGLSLPTGDAKWVCVVAGNRSCYTSNTRRQMGHFKAKLRQLDKIGYRVIEVPWFEYNRLPSDKKQRYLVARLKTSSKKQQMYNK